MRNRVLSAVLFVLGLSGSPSAAQTEPEVIHPGHPDFNPSVFEPFEADYDQSGVTLTVQLRRTTSERPLLSLLMISQGETVGVDHVAHHADDMSFAFRKFAYGRFGHEYVNLENNDDRLELARLPLASKDPAKVRYIDQQVEEPFFDGTFLFWLLAGLPLESDGAWRMRTWRLLEDGLEQHDSPPFRVEGRETVNINGETFNCWVITAFSSTRPEGLRNYVIQQAPYLIQQEMVRKGDGSVLGNVLKLKRLR